MRNPPILIAVIGFFGALAGMFWLYLGLRLRFNSWDVLTHAPTVVEAAHDALFGPGVAGVYVAAFAAFLWLVYTVADIWFDGLQLRTAQWRGPRDLSRDQFNPASRRLISVLACRRRDASGFPTSAHNP